MKIPHRVILGGFTMFPNLDAELVRIGMSTKELAKIIGTSEKTANNNIGCLSIIQTKTANKSV